VVDNIFANSILPVLAREMLNRTIEAKEISSAGVVMREGKLVFEVA
jgi:hypothetical protein